MRKCVSIFRLRFVNFINYFTDQILQLLRIFLLYFGLSHRFIYYLLQVRVDFFWLFYNERTDTLDLIETTDKSDFLGRLFMFVVKFLALEIKDKKSHLFSKS